VSDDHIAREFADDFWNKKLPANDSVLFFDLDFVAKNVHEYERKTTKGGQEQESGKLIIEFDGGAVKLRDSRDKAKKEKDKQDKRISDFEELNKESLDFSLNEEEDKLFLKYIDTKKDEIEPIIGLLSKEEKDLVKSSEADSVVFYKVAKIQKDLKPLSAPTIDLNLSDYEMYQEIFNFDLKEKTQIEAKQTLVDKIAEHKSFFESGITLRKTHSNQCPFCQSETEEDGIALVVDLYNQIFDTTYKAQVELFNTKKEEAVSQLNKLLRNLEAFDLVSIFLELKQIDEDYKIPQIYSINNEKSFSKPKVDNIKKLRDKILYLEKPNKEDIKDIYKKVNIEFKEVVTFSEAIDKSSDEKNKEYRRAWDIVDEIGVGELIKNTN
jgi:hypothetical protein